MHQDVVELQKMTSDMGMQQGELGEDGGPTGASGYAGAQDSKNKDISELSSHMEHGIIRVIDLKKHEKLAKEEQAAQLPAGHARQEPSDAYGGARPKVRNHFGIPPSYAPHIQAAGAAYQISPSQAQKRVGMGDGPKSRKRQVLSLIDPNTGEDITEKVFKSVSREKLDPSMLESQAHLTDTPMSLPLVSARHRLLMEGIRHRVLKPQIRRI